MNKPTYRMKAKQEDPSEAAIEHGWIKPVLHPEGKELR